MAERLISSLEAKKGLKFDQTGECVGTHVAGRRRHVVFLPRGCTPGQTCRVALEVIKDAAGNPRKDKAGREMYRGVPAPVEYSDRWKDNGDGTLSRATVSKDWLGREREEGVIETRPVATREDAANRLDRTTAQVVWGPDLSSSAVEETPIFQIPQQREGVAMGQLLWKTTGYREERNAPLRYTISKVGPYDCSWWRERLAPTYRPDAEVIVRVSYTRVDGTHGHTHVSTWGTMPVWWQTEQEARYPLCACGRLRREPQSDGYGECELCRAEEACARCGKQGSVAVVAGRLICAACKLYEEQEQLVNQVVTASQRQAFARQAARLLAGNSVPRETGEAVVRSTLSHVHAAWKRDDLVQKHTGYGWYYFCDDGVFASKFSPAALRIVESLPQAAGNSLVELVAWLAGPQRAEHCQGRDFYWRTQVEGKTVSPRLSAASLQTLAVCVRLRGSEAARTEALARYRALVEKLGDGNEQVKAVAEILNGDEQDYEAALAKVREAEELLAAAERKDVLVNYGGAFRARGRTGNRDYWVVRPDGSLRDPDALTPFKRSSAEGEKRWRVVAPEELAISWSKRSSAAPHEFRVDHLPEGECTSEQLATVRRLEEEIDETWRGATGLASGQPSPPVDAGWRLHAPGSASKAACKGRGLQALLEKWGDPRHKK